LIVEDDFVLAKGLCDNLLAEGFDTHCVHQGDRALSAAAALNPELVLLDLRLPGMSGFELCKAFRRRGNVPVLVLTALSQKVDKIRCLDLGADDYLTKPFDLDELLARIRALLRRARPVVQKLTLGPIAIDFQTRFATRDRTELDLTHREFEILHYLAEREGHVVSRDELLKELWGYSEKPFTRSVDAAIARLRRKIEADAHRPRFIHTVHGDGYCLTANGQAHP